MAYKTSTVKQSLEGIPLPIVTLNRVVLLGGIISAIALQLPIITTLLFLIMLSAALFGRKGSFIFFIGVKLFAERNHNAATEDPKLMRFNNAIAAILLGFAQIAFLFGAPMVGWIFCSTVAIAAAIALGGFCFGCFLFFQFNLQRYKLFSKLEECGKK